jgi:hypothetical protein
MVAVGVLYGVILLATLFLIAFDIWIKVHWGVEATISRAMSNLDPMLLAASCFVTGGGTVGLMFHFWFTQPAPRGWDEPSRSGQPERSGERFDGR